MKDLDLSTFTTTDKNQWTQLAEIQLKGEDPRQALKWETQGMSLEGYYDASDISDLKYLEDFFSIIKSHRWKLYEEIEVSNAKSANSDALKALMGGCDGIIVNLQSGDGLDEVLTNVDTNICDVNIISESEVERSDLTGFNLGPKGNCLGSVKSDPIEQIFELISKMDSERYVHRKAMADFFLEIASVRALKYLLDQNAFKEIHIHTHIPSHNSEDHQWFLNTTAGLASILGGSHSIDLSTMVGDSRISRNTGNLIREESGIEEYTDQCGGSYYVEVLTDKIIKTVSEKLK